MPVSVRPAPPDFVAWDALLALLHRAFAFQQGRIDPPSSLHRFDPVSLAAKAREETLFFAFDGAQVVGCIFAKPRGDVLYVGKFAVEPGCQGRGVGRQLMGAAEDLARCLGLRTLELETRIELTENHQTFAAMGFVRTAENAHAGFDRPTSVTMRKQLS